MSQNEDKSYISFKANKIELFENGVNTARVERNWVRAPWSFDNFFVYCMVEKFFIGNEEYYYDDIDAAFPFWYYFFGERKTHSIVDKNNNILYRTEILDPKRNLADILGLWAKFSITSRIYLLDDKSFDISGDKNSLIQFKVPLISLPVKDKIYKISVNESSAHVPLSNKEITELKLFGFYDQWANRKKIGMIIILTVVLSTIMTIIFSKISW